MGGKPIFYLWRRIAGQFLNDGGKSEKSEGAWQLVIESENSGPEILGSKQSGLEKLLDSTVTGLGYELVHVELPGRGRLIRLFIDRPEGITVDDCAFVSNHLSRLFTVENIDYDRLEVSSPGLDRPLKTLRDFERFVGQEAELKLRLPLNGRKKFVGTLKGVQEQSVLLEMEGALLTLKVADLDKARLVPKL